MPNYQLFNWKSKVKVNEEVSDFSAKAGRTEKNKSNLWNDLRRDAISVIHIKDKTLISLLQEKTSLGQDAILDDNDAEKMINLIREIIQEQLLDPNDPHNEKKSASLVEHLYQHGVGYLATDGLSSQLNLAGYCNPTSKSNFEEHKMYLNRVGNSIEINSTSKYVNISKLDKLGRPTPPIVDLSNKETLIASYTSTKVSFNYWGKARCGQPIAVVAVANETLLKGMSDLQALGPKIFDEIGSHLKNYKSYLIKEYKIPYYLENTCQFMKKYDTKISLPLQKLAMVNNLLDIAANDTAKSDPQKLFEFHKQFEQARDLLKQHQKPKEITIFQQLKNFISKHFGLISKGEEMIQKITQRLPKETNKFFKAAYGDMVLSQTSTNEIPKTSEPKT